MARAGRLDGVWEDERAPGWRASLRRWRVAAWLATLAIGAAFVAVISTNSGWWFLLILLLVPVAVRAHGEVGALKGRLDRPCRRAADRAEKQRRKQN